MRKSNQNYYQHLTFSLAKTGLFLLNKLRDNGGKADFVIYKTSSDLTSDFELEQDIFVECKFHNTDLKLDESKLQLGKYCQTLITTPRCYAISICDTLVSLFEYYEKHAYDA